jgi:hypothetical protein
MFGLASREGDVWASGRWWIYVFMHASLTFLLDMAKAAATVALGIIAPARGPDGVTRRNFFVWKNGIFFHITTATSEMVLSADPFNFEPKTRARCWP